MAIISSVAIIAVLDEQFVVGSILGILFMLVVSRFLVETARSMNSLYIAFGNLGVKESIENVTVIRKEEVNRELDEVINSKHHISKNIVKHESRYPVIRQERIGSDR